MFPRRPGKWPRHTTRWACLPGGGPTGSQPWINTVTSVPWAWADGACLGVCGRPSRHCRGRGGRGRKQGRPGHPQRQAIALQPVFTVFTTNLRDPWCSPQC